jgi:DNA ligase (NAD+)
MLASHFLTYENFKNKMKKMANLSKENLPQDNDFIDLVAIDGIGEKMTFAIIEHFKDLENVEMITEVAKSLQISDAIIIKSDSKLAGKSVVFTGTMERMTRMEAKK